MVGYKCYIKKGTEFLPCNPYTGEVFDKGTPVPLVEKSRKEELKAWKLNMERKGLIVKITNSSDNKEGRTNEKHYIDKIISDDKLTEDQMEQIRNSFEEQAKKVITDLTEDDINVLKDIQNNIKGYTNRLEEVVERIFGFDYSDSKNYDKIKEIFPDIEDISQEGEVWSKNGLDIEIPQITDDGHTVRLWLGLYAETQLLEDYKGILSPITLQFSLETDYGNNSEPWHIVTRCVPMTFNKEK